MNVMKIIAILRFLIENKAQVEQLIELIQQLLSSKHLIGDDGSTTLPTAEEFPALSGAVMAAGSSWSELIKLLVDNLDSLQEIVTLVMQLVKLFEAKR